ncbi:MAG: hypothetical protein M0P64_01985 [Candidatus Pacebacteria bacterium]|jgi:hypothetical protein|nr:hypothetical protein [Candidatus Paceibacterota bacterium]
MPPLTKDDLKILSQLNTPQKIQDFLDELPQNNEDKGETCMSPARVLLEKKAHCIEGAMLAAVAIWLQGEKPLIMSLKVAHGDDDHIIALYKVNGYWGAISKTNHAVLRFRDPIYRTPRELALSYYHEYFLTSNGKKTMVGYSRPVNLRRFGTNWVVAENDLWELGNAIYTMDHIPVVPKGNERYIRNAHPLEREAASIKEWEVKN